MQPSTETIAVESFEQMFENFENKRKAAEGDVLEVLVTECDSARVTVAAGLKSDCEIPAEEFRDSDGELGVKPGDYVKVKIELLDDGRGHTRLSHMMYRREQTWADILRCFESRKPIEGVIQERVKGGYSVFIDGLRCFLPGSLVDIFPVSAPQDLLGKRERFMVERLKEDFHSAILNRKIVRENDLVGNDMNQINFAEGDVLRGKVAAIAEYPECTAFIKLGEGVHGRLHRSDLSWTRINQLSEILAPDDEIEVKVLKIDEEKQRVKVGVRQLLPDPYEELQQRCPPGTRIFGKVTAIKEYGAFIEIEKGLEGLVHTSEMDWHNNNVTTDQIMSIGDDIEVMMLGIDMQQRRISLGIKQCKPNPWEEFNIAYRKGTKLPGTVQGIMEFGLFIVLQDGLTGLVHISDLSNTESGQEAILNYQKDQQIDVVLLSVDVKRERISLGIKQLAHGSFDSYVKQNPPPRSMVTGEVIKIGERSALLRLAENVHGTLHISELTQHRINDLNEHLKIGDKKEVLILSADMAKRTMMLSIKAKDRLEQDKAIRDHKKSEAVYAKSPSTAFGEMLKHTIASADKSAQPGKQSADTASQQDAEPGKTSAEPVVAAASLSQTAAAAKPAAAEPETPVIKDTAKAAQTSKEAQIVAETAGQDAQAGQAGNGGEDANSTNIAGNKDDDADHHGNT